MRRVLFLTLGFVFLAGGFGRSAQPAAAEDVAKELSEKAVRETGSSAADDLLIGEPSRHANLAIFPISSRTEQSADRFITLDVGLKAGTVEVMELGAQPSGEAAQRQVPAAEQAASQPADDPFGQPAAPPSSATNRRRTARANSRGNSRAEAATSGPSVNHLQVLNRSERPLYLMPGEIIVGGQQDRTVAHEYVIAPAEKPTAIDVFCVEHGRWRNRNARETREMFSEANAPQALSESVSVTGGNAANVADVAAKAEEGKFVASLGNVSKGARMAVQGKKGQGEVWNRVAEANRKSGASSTSGAFTANYAAAPTLRRLEPYVAAVNRPIADRSQIVGVLVAVNGRVESLDVFESTPLFRQLWPKLLKSYALDAINAPAEGADKTCSIDEAQQFLAKVRAARVANISTDQGLVTSTRDSGGVICFSAHEKRTPVSGAAGGGMRGSFGGAVHTSGFAK